MTRSIPPEAAEPTTKQRVERRLTEVYDLALIGKATAERVELELGQRIDEVRVNASKGFRKVAESHAEIMKKLDLILDHIAKGAP